MALVERLMGLEEPKIPVHTFFAAMQEVVNGNLTGTQVKNYLNMDQSAQDEYDAIGALYPTGTTALAYFNKTTFISRIHAVFILAETREMGYDTPAAVRTKIGL